MSQIRHLVAEFEDLNLDESVPCYWVYNNVVEEIRNELWDQGYGSEPDLRAEILTLRGGTQEDRGRAFSLGFLHSAWIYVCHAVVLADMKDAKYWVDDITPHYEDLNIPSEDRLASSLAILSQGQFVYGGYLRYSQNPVSVALTLPEIGTQVAARRWQKPREAAQLLAENLWKSDGDNPRLIGLMVEAILDEWRQNPDQFGRPDPPLDKTIRSWISVVSPSEARRPGRPKKK